jgi:hypothetical protein
VLPRNVSADLLDANGTTWAFGRVERVGPVNNPQVNRLAMLASREACRSYCGRTADARLCVRRGSAERERVLAVRGAQHRREGGTLDPLNATYKFPDAGG